MNRYEIIKDEVYQILTTDCSKNKRKDGLDHLFSVTTMCQYLARINNLDIEIAAIRNHSHKERIDDPYSELIKDADTLVLYLSDSQAILSNEKQARINQLLGDK